MTFLGIFLIALGLLIIKGALHYRKIERELHIDRNVIPASERDRQIKERIETMNRQSVAVIEARRLCGYRQHEYKEATINQGLMRGTKFNLN